MHYLFNKNSKITYSILLLTLITFFYGLSRDVSAQTLSLDTTFSGGVSDAPPRVYSSTTLASGKILVGGSFTSVNGSPKPYLVRLNADGTIDNSFNANSAGPSSTVYETVELSDGKILVTGSFAAYNGVTKGGIVRLNADGSLDTNFNPSGAGVSGTVQGISLQTDGKILISGSNIVSYNGVSRFSVIRLNADGTLDTTFTSPFTSALFVEEVDVQADGKVLIAGVFSIGTPVRTNIARLNANGSLDTTFNPSGGGTDGDIYAMIIQADGKIIIGGNFFIYNNVGRAVIARINTDGSLDTTFNAGVLEGSSAEHFSLQPDGKILAAGRFIDLSSQIFPAVRLNTNGTLDSSFQPVPTNDTGYNVKYQADGKIIVTGFFTKVGDVESRKGIVRYNSDGTIDGTFNGSIINIGTIDSFARQADGKIVVAGTFQKANGTASFNVARFNANGTLDTTFQTGTGIGPHLTFNTIVVYDISIQADGKIILGGIFNSYNGEPRASVIRLNSNGSIDNSFNTTYFDSLELEYTYSIYAQPDGKIIIGGYYLNQFGNFSSLVRLNSDGSLDTTFNNGSLTTANNIVRHIRRQSDGKYIIVGAFTNYGGTARNRIARLNADGTLDTTFNPGTGANGNVFDAVIQPDGKILIGGNFTTYNGTTRNRLARINADGTLDTTLNPGTGTNNTVYTILPLTDGKIMIGGYFSTYNGTAANRLARVNPDGSLDTTFVSGIENQSFTNVRDLLLQPDGKILIAGDFNSYNGIARNSLARLTTAAPRPAKFDFDGDGRSDISVFRPSNSGWYVNRSTSGFFAVQWGLSTDKLAPADYDGDGKTDVGVFRPENGVWYWIRSSDNVSVSYGFGLSGDIPAPADYDGDGKADLAVFRPSNGVWYIQGSQQGFYAVQFGISTDVPVSADYDGDGKTDIAVYRDGVWYQNRSSQGVVIFQFGQANDKPIVGDYDGDGKADAAVYRGGTWYILGSAQGYFGFQYGIGSDIPAPADYDGDGKTDAAVFRDGVWYQLLTQAGSQTFQFGQASDKPVPSAFIP